jgi:hypothetical protein
MSNRERARATSKRLAEIDMRRADGYETYADANGMPAAMIQMLKDINYLRSFDLDARLPDGEPTVEQEDKTNKS